MDTFLSLPYEHDSPLPLDEEHEFRTPDALVERFLAEHTEPGDTVLDPFAGFGTTLEVAERMDRDPYGIEYERERVGYVRERIESPDDVRQGSVLDLDSSWVPAIDCCFTSPPFMERTDDRNPFRNYAGESSYDEYLDDVETAFERIGAVLATDGTVVVDVSNMKYQDRVTTLAWDVAERGAAMLDFAGEVVVGWEGADDGDGVFGYGYDHSYCLVFSADGD
ncbi:site-specific DNA-methyltransferase [Haloarchaeobius sp. FL176]|uniref:site-specific DNA-methyltransferase n=1 Tax=Haloarchaeobius sp. FL176 TaxID=2967129 RepID=UPI0021473CBF|nr:site-specific DNA-methyltransferase [Haloarchaeobius sp. FL176]